MQTDAGSFDSVPLAPYFDQGDSGTVPANHARHN
jgi:hypothetical protein